MFCISYWRSYCHSLNTVAHAFTCRHTNCCQNQKDEVVTKRFDLISKTSDFIITSPFKVRISLQPLPVNQCCDIRACKNRFFSFVAQIILISIRLQFVRIMCRTEVIHVDAIILMGCLCRSSTYTATFCVLPELKTKPLLRKLSSNSDPRFRAPATVFFNGPWHAIHSVCNIYVAIESPGPFFIQCCTRRARLFSLTNHLPLGTYIYPRIVW